MTGMQRTGRRAAAGPGRQESRPLRRGLPVLAAAALACLAAACGETPSDPEAALRAALAGAEAAVEAGDADALAAMVSPDYADAAGRDRRAMAVLLRGLVMRYRRVEILVTVERIELFSPVLARAELRVAAAGAGAGRLDADAFPLSLSLRDDGDGWRVTSAEWGGAGGI